MHLSSARRTVRVFVVASLVALVSRPTHGQRLVPGDTLRIAGAHSTFGGVLLSRDSGALVMLRAGRGDTLRLLHTDISRVEVLRGRHYAGTKTIGKGALVGLGIGSVAAVLMLQEKGGNREGRQMWRMAAFSSVVAGTVTGTLVGAVASLRQVDHWVPFDYLTNSQGSP